MLTLQNSKLELGQGGARSSPGAELAAVPCTMWRGLFAVDTWWGCRAGGEGKKKPSAFIISVGWLQAYAEDTGPVTPAQNVVCEVEHQGQVQGQTSFWKLNLWGTPTFPSLWLCAVLCLAVAACGAEEHGVSQVALGQLSTLPSGPGCDEGTLTSTDATFPTGFRISAA